MLTIQYADKTVDLVHAVPGKYLFDVVELLERIKGFYEAKTQEVGEDRAIPQTLEHPTIALWINRITAHLPVIAGGNLDPNSLCQECKISLFLKGELKNFLLQEASSPVRKNTVVPEHQLVPSSGNPTGDLLARLILISSYHPTLVRLLPDHSLGTINAIQSQIEMHLQDPEERKFEIAQDAIDQFVAENGGYLEEDMLRFMRGDE